MLNTEELKKKNKIGNKLKYQKDKSEICYSISK